MKSRFHTSAFVNEIMDERKIMLDDKSKIEEYVEHRRKKRETNLEKLRVVEEKLQDAFIYKPERPASEIKKEEKLPMKDRIMKEVMHYYNGFRLLYLDCKVAAKLLWRVLHGETLTRRERRQVCYCPFCSLKVLVIIYVPNEAMKLFITKICHTNIPGVTIVKHGI